MVCTQFLGFRNFIHDCIVVLQQPPALFHVVCFQNLLTGFLNGQFRGTQLPAVHHRIITVVNSVVPAVLTGLDSKIALAAQFPCSLLVLCLNFRVEVGMVSFHDLGKLADVEHIAQTAHVKVVIIQMFQPCRKAAPIRVILLYNSAIGNAVEVVIVAVDETNILRQRFRLPDAPPADASLRDVFEDLYAFLLDGLTVIVRKFKQIPVPGGRDGVLSIWRQILFRDLPTFQRLASYLVISGKADPCTVFPEMQIPCILYS